MTGPTDATWSERSGHSISDARALYEGAYNGRGFEIAETDQPFAYRYTTSGGGGITLRGNLFAGDVRGTTDTSSEYIVTWITTGHGTLDLGRGDVELTPGVPVMFPTGRPQRFHFRDYRQNLMHFDSGFLERVAATEHGPDLGPADLDLHAGRSSGLTRIRFLEGRTPDPDDLAAWNAAVATAARTLLRPGVGDLAREEANRAAARALLRAFPHEILPALPESIMRHRSTNLREAIEYVHAHAHLPIDVLDVAGHAGLTIRGLQQGFSRHLGTSPSEYLRTVRLERVRQELRTGPVEESIGSIAARWGFAHAGRFSIAYAKAFGEHPRETRASSRWTG